MTAAAPGHAPHGGAPAGRLLRYYALSRGKGDLDKLAVRVDENPRSSIISIGYLAEREGFEPPVRLPVLRISSAARSTTLPPLRKPWRLVGEALASSPRRAPVQGSETASRIPKIGDLMHKLAE